MSVEAPERIWAWEYKGHSPWGTDKPDLDVVKNGAEYVRADKLEELAAENEATRQDIERYIQINTDLLAENERLRRELSATTAERKRAQEACQQISEKAEAALAEKDKEIDWQRLCDVINAANRVSARTGKEHVTDANELREFALARNAGGNDEPCRGCGDGDKVPASGYWRCPVCDAEWSGEDAE